VLTQTPFASTTIDGPWPVHKLEQVIWEAVLTTLGLLGLKPQNFVGYI